jgi:hypothetical protein
VTKLKKEKWLKNILNKLNSGIYYTPIYQQKVIYPINIPNKRA